MFNIVRADVLKNPLSKYFLSHDLIAVQMIEVDLDLLKKVPRLIPAFSLLLLIIIPVQNQGIHRFENNLNNLQPDTRGSANEGVTNDEIPENPEQPLALINDWNKGGLIRKYFNR